MFYLFRVWLPLSFVSLKIVFIKSIVSILVETNCFAINQLISCCKTPCLSQKSVANYRIPFRRRFIFRMRLRFILRIIFSLIFGFFIYCLILPQGSHLAKMPNDDRESKICTQASKGQDCSICFKLGAHVPFVYKLSPDLCWDQGPVEKNLISPRFVPWLLREVRGGPRYRPSPKPSHYENFLQNWRL